LLNSKRPMLNDKALLGFPSNFGGPGKNLGHPRMNLERLRKNLGRPSMNPEGPRKNLSRPRMNPERPRKKLGHPKMILERPRIILFCPRFVLSHPRFLLSCPSFLLGGLKNVVGTLLPISEVLREASAVLREEAGASCPNPHHSAL